MEGGFWFACCFWFHRSEWKWHVGILGVGWRLCSLWQRKAGFHHSCWHANSSWFSTYWSSSFLCAWCGLLGPRNWKYVLSYLPIPIDLPIWYLLYDSACESVHIGPIGLASFIELGHNYFSEVHRLCADAIVANQFHRNLVWHRSIWDGLALLGLCNLCYPLVCNCSYSWYQAYHPSTCLYWFLDQTSSTGPPHFLSADCIPFASHTCYIL